MNTKVDVYNSYYFMILRPFVTNKKMINGWSFEMELESGCFYFSKQFGKKTISIFATPYWEDNDGVEIGFCNVDSGDYIQIDMIHLDTPTGNSVIDSELYFKMIKDVLAEYKTEH